jgi:hypothetical protein
MDCATELPNQTLLVNEAAIHTRRLGLPKGGPPRPLRLVGGMPDRHSKDSGQVGAHHPVEGVKKKNRWRDAA